MIRIAAPEDIGAITRLFQSVQELHAIHLPAIFKKPSDERTLTSWLASIFANLDAYVLLYEVEGEAVGYIYAHDVRRDESVIRPALHYFSLEHIAVAPSFQRRGVGTALLNALVMEVKSRKIDRIELDVWSFNEKSQQFFARHGFAVINQRMEACLMDG